MKSAVTDVNRKKKLCDMGVCLKTIFNKGRTKFNSPLFNSSIAKTWIKTEMYILVVFKNKTFVILLLILTK